MKVSDINQQVFDHLISAIAKLDFLSAGEVEEIAAQLANPATYGHEQNDKQLGTDIAAALRKWNTDNE